MERPGSEAAEHAEGPIAHAIERYMAKVPADWFLWAAGESIIDSLTLRCPVWKENARIVGPDRVSNG